MSFLFDDENAEAGADLGTGTVVTRERDDERVGRRPYWNGSTGSGGRRPRRWGRRLLVVLGLLAVGAVVAFLAGSAWLQRRIDPSGPPGDTVAFTIPEGATTDEVGELLAEAGIISDATVWRYYIRFRADGATFEAGEYALPTNSSMGDAVAGLAEGPALAAAAALVTIPEGLTLAEVAVQVGEEGLSSDTFRFLADSGGVRSRFQPDDISTLEGLLLPETYRLEQGEGEEALLRRMVETLDGTAVEIGYDFAQARVGLTPYEVLIIASLIEEEARIDEDRGMISRVIYNRLERGETLGIDATVYYAVGKPGGVPLTRSDLASPSPYNTRLVAGLPPTPIAVPGRASLEAALNPVDGPWLFYVLADACGRHAFSEDISQFNRDVAAAREQGLLDPTTTPACTE